MEPTTIALVALICTRNNLLCRDATEGTKFYETVESCREVMDRIPTSMIPEGYKLVSRCVPVTTQNDGRHRYEWALNWAGEPVAYTEASSRKAIAEGNRPAESETGNGEIGAAAKLKPAETGRVRVTLHTVASLE